MLRGGCGRRGGWIKLREIEKAGIERRILRQQNRCPRLRSRIRENIKGLRTRLNTKQSDEQLAFAQTISSDCLTADPKSLKFSSGFLQSRRSTHLPPQKGASEHYSFPALQFICPFRRHDSFPVNLAIRKEYEKGTPLEKETSTDLWRIFLAFLKAKDIVDNVPLSYYF